MPETPQQLSDRLKFEYDASQNMDGILFEDENREPVEGLSQEKPPTGEIKVILPRLDRQIYAKKQKSKQEKKVDSNDLPNIKLTDTPFWQKK